MGLRWVAIVTTLTVLLTGCGGPTVPTMEVGQCTNALTQNLVEEIPVVSCDQPHHWEAFAVHEMADAPEAPAEDKIATQAEEFCVAEFTKFIGVPLDDSDLEVQYLFPSADSWQLKDRTILCLVGDDQTTTTGTLKDSKRRR